MPQRSLLFGLSLVLAACSGQANEATAPASAATVQAPAGTPATVADDDTVVASWNGGQLTFGEVSEAAKGTLTKLEVEYLSSRYAALSSTLSGLLEERLLKGEATTRNMTVEALIKAEVDDKLDPPSKAELERFYKQNIRRFKGQPYGAVESSLEQYLMRQKQGERYAAFMGDLQKQVNAQIKLARPELPRFNIGADDDPIRGDVNAAITIVEFADYQCAYCEKALPALTKLLTDYEGQVRLVFRDFPLSFHQRAVPASVAANCAGEQDKYWEMHDLLMTNQKKLEDDDLDGYAKQLELNMSEFATCKVNDSQVVEIMADMAEAQAAGVSGTPAFFVNGVLLSGAQPYEAFKAVIDAELADQAG